MKNNKDQRITFRIDKNLHEKLKTQAKSKDISLSELVREQIEKGNKDER